MKWNNIAKVDFDHTGRVFQRCPGEFPVIADHGSGEVHTSCSTFRLLTQSTEPFPGNLFGESSLRLSLFN